MHAANTRITMGTWSTPATGLITGFDNQTTNDDMGNLWTYQDESTLLSYNTSTGITTTYPLPIGLGGGEPRITWDSCNQLLYITDFTTL